MVAKAGPKLSKWEKVAGAHSDWEKDEFLDVIYWGRQILGLICGVVWGVVGFDGFQFMGIYLLANCLLTFSFYRSYLRVDEEEFGGHGPIMNEGFAPSSGLFTLLWMLIYTGLHA